MYLLTFNTIHQDIILTYNQHKIISDTYIFYMKSLKSNVYLKLTPVSVWIRYVTSTQQPHVASGYHIGQLSSGTQEQEVIFYHM